jgi:hypothetical protein
MGRGRLSTVHIYIGTYRYVYIRVPNDGIIFTHLYIQYHINVGKKPAWRTSAGYWRSSSRFANQDHFRRC